jgi:tetratricopeptide (TPR) repeat protein
VEKALFEQLLLNYTALNANEAVEIEQLSKQFPFSQLLHLMAARAAQDNALPNREELLHTSAIYSTDRSVLKNVMVSPRTIRISVVETPSTPSQAELPEVSTVVAQRDVNTESIYQQVIDDLASLQESKRIYEATIERLENEKLLPLAQEAKEVKVKEAKEVKAVENEGNPDELIQEIKSTKKKIKPESDKQKEQIEIIDQFIKAKPSVPKPTKSSVNSEDLAETSADFNENIVSETLVEILLKQGKKEKAIEALKKLIWKFPQKKAYFAARIEELKK